MQKYPVKVVKVLEKVLEVFGPSVRGFNEVVDLFEEVVEDHRKVEGLLE